MGEVHWEVAQTPQGLRVSQLGWGFETYPVVGMRGLVLTCDWDTRHVTRFDPLHATEPMGSEIRKVNAMINKFLNKLGLVPASVHEEVTLERAAHRRKIERLVNQMREQQETAHKVFVREQEQHTKEIDGLQREKDNLLNQLVLVMWAYGETKSELDELKKAAA